MRVWVITSGRGSEGQYPFGVATDKQRGDVIKAAMEHQHACHGLKGKPWLPITNIDWNMDDPPRGWQCSSLYVWAHPYEIKMVDA